MDSEIVVPLLHKSRPIGALNILSRTRDQFTAARRRASLRQFAAHVAVAHRQRAAVRAEPAATRRRSRRWPRSAATSRRCSISTSCSRASRSSPRRVIDYRTFGILLLNEDAELEIKLAVQYGEKVAGAARAARRRAGRLRRAATASRCSCRRLAGSALHQRRARRPLGAGDSAAAEGSLHRRASISRARSSTRSRSATSRS